MCDLNDHVLLFNQTLKIHFTLVDSNVLFNNHA